MAMPSFDIEGSILTGLEALSDFGNGYDFKSLKYPDDIEHFFMHGHYINFFVNVQRASKYFSDDGKTYDYPAGVTGSTGLLDMIGLGGSGISSQYYPISEGYFGEDLTAVGGSAQSGINKLTTQRITQAISLYIPDSMSFGAEIGWDQVGLTDFGKKTLTNALTSAADKVGMGGALKSMVTAGEYVGRAAGFALNPEILVLFRGINLRTFQYDFFFSPKNEREALAIQNIVKAFRFHAAPEVNEGFGLFYVAPSTFDIEFMHRGDRNKCVHQVKTCVLTGYSVDYAPSGWSTHIDGMPIQTRMTLTFQETELLTKEHISQGF